MSRTSVVLAAVVLAVVGTGFAPAGVEVVDLGTLPGATTSEAVDVNDSGMVAGRSGDHAVRWSGDGVIQDLGTVGGVTSEAVDINARGDVAGTLSLSNGQRHAVRWDAAGVGTDLGTLPGGAESWAVAVNDRGTVIGNGYAPIPGGFEQHALRWDRWGRTDLASPYGWSEAHAINKAGIVVGSALTAEGPGLAARWDQRGRLTFLGRLPGSVRSEAYRINDAGVAVGHAYTADGQDHAVRWDSQGRITDLGTLPGASYSSAFALNEKGTIVGISAVGAEVFPSHAVRWDRHVRVDLGTLAGDSYSDATHVNRRGTIIGRSGFSAVWWDARGRLTRLDGIDGDADTYAAALNDKDVVVGTSRSHATLWRLPQGRL